MKFLNWASSKEMAIKGMMDNITMARSSVWEDPVVRSKMNPGLIQTLSLIHISEPTRPY